MPTPAYELADDPRAYRAERATYERARALAELLVRATGAWPLPRPVLAADEAQDRRDALEHFAHLARRGLAINARWQPSAIVVRAILRRGLSVSEVLERARAL